jgi:pimeloyl-ACP methyl ester carboxylesterase
MRDIAGPDGFAETSELDVSGRMFGVIGAEPGMSFAAELPLSAFLQLAADVLSTIRLAREGDIDAIRAADPALAELAFDPERVMFVGNSMGAVVGTAVAVASPDLASVVLNVAPGSIVDTLVQSTTFRPLSETVLLPAIGIDSTFDEVDRSMALDPTVDLYRWALEAVDPLALAPSLLADRVFEGAPSVLIQLAGHDEVAAPGPSQAFARATGLPGVGTFALADVPAAALPTDAVIWRYDGASHGMLEVAAGQAAWQEPLVPPLMALDPPQALVNPIEAVHDQIEAFVRQTVQTGRGTVSARAVGP